MSKTKDLNNKILEKRDLLLAKKEELLKNDKPSYKTSCLFRPNYHTQRGEINIKSASENEVVEAMMSLRNRSESRSELGLDNGKHLGYDMAEWIEDFKTRVNVINRNKNLQIVQSLEEELSTYLTTEQLREIGIGEVDEKINSFLNS